jgi:predicted MFS family arabinose efflux permease
MIIWLFLLTLTVLLPSNLTENSEEINKSIVKIDSDDGTNVSKCGNTTTGCRMSNVLCLYYLIFHSTLSYIVTSFYLPLLSKYRLGLGLRHVKLIYLNGSLAGILSYLATYIFVEKFSEKIFIVFGTALTITPVSVIFYFALFWYDNMPVSAVYLLLVSMIIVRGVFVNFSLICSLLSKLTPVENAAFYQSLTFTIAHVGIILGRLIAGVTFSRLPMMYTCLCLTISWLVGLIWVGIEYKNL